MADVTTNDSSKMAGAVGHGLGALVGVAALAAGIAALASSIPHVVGVTLVVTGVVLPLLTYKSMQRSRAAWAFLVSVLAVLATVTFFGAPKIGRVLGIGLVPALFIPALELVAVVALARVRSQYRAVAS